MGEVVNFEDFKHRKAEAEKQPKVVEPIGPPPAAPESQPQRPNLVAAVTIPPFVEEAVRQSRERDQERIDELAEEAQRARTIIEQTRPTDLKFQTPQSPEPQADEHPET